MRRAGNPDNQLCPFSSPRSIWFSYRERYIQQILNTYYQNKNVSWQVDDCFLKPVCVRTCNFLKTIYWYFRNNHNSKLYCLIQYSCGYCGSLWVFYVGLTGIVKSHMACSNENHIPNSLILSRISTYFTKSFCSPSWFALQTRQRPEGLHFIPKLIIVEGDFYSLPSLPSAPFLVRNANKN